MRVIPFRPLGSQRASEYIFMLVDNMVELPLWMRATPEEQRLKALWTEQGKLLDHPGGRWWQLPRLTFTTPAQASQLVGEAKWAGVTFVKKDGFWSTTQLSKKPDIWCVKAGHELTVWDMSGRHPFLLQKQDQWHTGLEKCYVPRRIRQYIGTCYYNAALHALVCAPRLAAFLLEATMKAISLLPDEERRTVMTQPLFDRWDVCRPLVTWTDMLRLLFTVLSDKAPSKVGGYGMSDIPTSPNSNIIKQIVHASGFRTTDVSVRGGDPWRVIVHLLARLGVSCKHVFRYSVSQRVRTTNTSTGGAAQVLMYTNPAPLFKRSVVDEGARYRLESCVLVSATHAIVGVWCGGAPYVYDSGKPDIQPCDWTVMKPTLNGETWMHRCILYAKLQ